MASLTTPHRRSTRTRRAPQRFDPDASKWVPGSANGSNNPTKIDHWQLRFNGAVGESKSEKKSDSKYENAIDWRMNNDSEAAKDRDFIVPDSVTIRRKRALSESDSESEYEFSDLSDYEDYDSACSWMSDSDESEDEHEDVSPASQEKEDDGGDTAVRIRHLPSSLRQFTDEEIALEKQQNLEDGLN